MALAVLDPDDLAMRITEALRLADRLRVLNATHVAVAAGIDPASLRRSANFPTSHRDTSALCRQRAPGVSPCRTGRSGNGGRAGCWCRGGSTFRRSAVDRRRDLTAWRP